MSHGGLDVVDGRKRLTIHQSFLKSFLTCPENARRGLLEETPQSDAAAIGSATHEAIQADLVRRMNGEDGLSPSEGSALARKLFFDELLPNATRSMGVDAPTYDKFVTNCVHSWFVHVKPHLPDAAIDAVEVYTRVPLGTFGDIEVDLAGTIDAVVDGLVYDWKTSGRKPKAWEMERWNLQSSFYLMLLDQDPTRTWEVRPMVRFAFMPRLKTVAEPTILDLERHSGWLSFVIEQARRVARFVEVFGLEEPWPLNDQHALCSEVWCPFWATCKGHYVGGSK